MKVWTCGRWVLFLMLISRSVFSQITVTVDSFYASPGDTISIPVSVGDVTDSSIESFQFDLFFSDSVLSPIDVTLEGTIAADWRAFVNKNNPGELRIGAYGLDYLTGSGPIVIMRFLVAGAIGDSTQLKVQNFIFNNGTPEVLIENGQLVIERIVQLAVQSNLAGMHVQIDGRNYLTPFSINLTAFSSHQIAIDSVLGVSEYVRYAFDHRSDGLPINHPIVMDSTNLNLNIFYQKQYYLTLQSEHDHPIGEGWYDKDSLATVAIDKYDSVGDSIRYRFLYWSGDTLLANENGIVKMDTSKILMANFLEEIFLSISYNRTNAGETVPAAPGIWVEKGEEVTVTAYPENDYHFLSWGGDTSATTNPLYFYVTAPFHIMANFGNIFPVELSAWKVKLHSGNTAELFWQTESETNNYGFYIQRKDSTSHFSDIAFVKGNGTSGKVHMYSFIDKNLQPGSYFYRLRQVDFSGKNHFSNVQSITVSKPVSNFVLENYPNPFNSSTKILLNLLATKSVDLRIFNLIGEEVYHFNTGVLEKGTHSFVWNGRSTTGRELPSGMYILRVITSNQTIRHKLILSK